MSDRHTIIYVDDSGDDKVGSSMTAVLIPAERWATCLGYWTKLRSELEDRHGLPRHFEIHSNAFLSAHPLKDEHKLRGRRSDIIMHREADALLDMIALARAQVELADVALDHALAAGVKSGRPLKELAAAAHLNGPDVVNRLERARSIEEFQEIACLTETGSGRRTRRKIYNQLLDQINALPEVTVITVTAEDGGKGTMSRIYAHLLTVIDEVLAAEERWGTVVVDGTPSARTIYYRDAHRNLDLGDRRILEDEVLRDSSESHFIQMADICAHSAFGVRQGDTERYRRLKDVVRTADGEPLGDDNPGFFAAPAGETSSS
jgi:hypothetical protein